MDLILPVAGAGLRTRPWSASRPKPLLPIAGRPMLARVLDAVLPLEPQRVVLITGWLGEQIEAWVRATVTDREVVVVRQRELRGQSHAVLQAGAALAGEGLIVFPDMLFALDPGVRSRLLAGPADGAVFTAVVADPANFAIAAPGPDGFIARLVEKPIAPLAGDAVIGMYWLREMPRLLAAIEQQIAQGITTRGGEHALADAIGLMIDDGARIAACPVEAWIGAGSNAGMLAANRWALERERPAAPVIPGSVVIEPCFIHPAAVIERSVIGPHASIGPGATVRGSIMRDSIVDDGAVVEGAMVAGSLVGRKTVVRGRARRLNVGDDTGS
jgi:glucose-1-phosphate thymidylyltransferase